MAKARGANEQRIRSGPSRGEIASRAVLATLVSLLLANALAVLVARMAPLEPRSALSLGGLLAFSAFGAASIAAFTIDRLARAWAIVGGVTLAATIAALVVPA